MRTNHLPETTRVRQGKEKEKLVLKLLNEREIEVCGHKISSWVPSSQAEDVRDKVDAWAVAEDGTRLSVQIKYRDMGTDLGIAAVRPYDSHMLFQMDVRAGTVRWDRDMKSKVDIYVCLADHGTKLIIANGLKVHMAVKMMLKALADVNDFHDRVFTDRRFWGAELRVVQDRGSGYSAGQTKIVCYLTAALMQKSGGSVFSINP